VRDRIRKTVAFAESVTEAQYAGAGERKVKLSMSGGKIIDGNHYLLQVTIPNVYFHLTTAYAILRHDGVDIGKMAFSWLPHMARRLIGRLEAFTR
jgi:hypothetical protein